MKVSAIAAIGKNRELGKDNKLLWHIKEDLQRFRNITKGHPVIMGRKTWESLPTKPLPKRYNIVITRDAKFKAEGAVVCNSIEESIKKAAASAEGFGEPKEIFIIGGGQIYDQAIKKGLVDKLYLTIIDPPAGGDSEADTFFPDYSEFKAVISEKAGESEGYKYKFLDLEK
ncbi:MAG: hypothetical protein A3B47_03390 [Candidatus Levybacteria bacterium RIFCSPLOWO2_01_FULL_39_24]|nr:MAG: hypothetical protein A2800_02680 [Candidatus Levybacteria bacterium RIFCSPHIGHO2_01_FULL_40_16]OGH28229.1 MAG: hypothetical protein A3E12_00650 [Candidatus Levybacteria bacterium RIFCSPHIGHO2_12_FULL_39_9]OGH46664.1 MAG: hypothetical protein A3B47_03390 [Candidatus Levybacteria bacterium RIFCSPLOWO2_01_FULL_39_24]